jgi:hypothetical protein
LSPSGKVCKGKSKPRPRNGLDLKSIHQRLRPRQPSYLGPAEQFTPEAQGFLFQLRVSRSFGNGAVERLDQLGDGREDRAVVVGERGILQPALEGRLRGLVDLSLAAGPQMDDRRAYALVRAESTPLASEPMLLPNAM